MSEAEWLKTNLWVWYGPDSIEVGSRAERSGSTHNDDAFAVCPALQLADSVLQLHHHAAWGTTRKEMNWNVIREINGGFFHCEKSYQRRHSCGRGCWWSAQRCLTPVWGDQWSLPGRLAASLWSPSHWSCGCWSCCSISAAALETDYTLPFIKIELMLLKLRWNIHLNNDFNPTRPVSSDERGILIFWWLIPWLISDDLLAGALLLFSFKWQVENYRKMNALRM